jgi:hypothetical protein
MLQKTIICSFARVLSRRHITIVTLNATHLATNLARTVPNRTKFTLCSFGIFMVCQCIRLSVSAKLGKLHMLAHIAAVWVVKRSY